LLLLHTLSAGVSTRLVAGSVMCVGHDAFSRQQQQQQLLQTLQVHHGLLQRGTLVYTWLWLALIRFVINSAAALQLKACI